MHHLECCADTPGVHYHHRLIHMLSPSEMKALHPLRKLRPYVAPTPRELCDRAGLNPDLGGNPAGYVLSPCLQHLHHVCMAELLCSPRMRLGRLSPSSMAV